MSLLKLERDLSSFPSSGEGSEVEGGILCSLLFLKPWLARSEKSVSQLFSQIVPLFLLAYTVFYFV